MKTNSTNKRYSILRSLTLLVPCLLVITGCEDFIKVDPPRTDLVRSVVFENDATADAAVVDIYYQLSASGFASGNSNSVSLVASFSADEQMEYGLNSALPEFRGNELSVANPNVESLWSSAYKAIYQANSVLEGAGQSTTLTDSLKTQFLGEAKFVRAFSYFYLVNLFGDVPLLLTSDYKANASAVRTPAAEVYTQMITDLTEAKSVLPKDYTFSNGLRVRPCSSTASAMLARVYLYTGQWAKAEAESSLVIDNTALFSLQTQLNHLMYANNHEAIWQFYNNFYPNDNLIFALYSAPPNVCALREDFLTSFESGDQRFVNWVGSISGGGTTYYFCKKYYADDYGAEFSTALRLAEQYLIRAEARAQLDNISGAQADINVIRTRAGLGNTTANDKTALLAAIEQERKVELFTEHGHRWLDLKRTGRLDAVIGPLKGSFWQSTDALYPIPQSQLNFDPAMAGQQNPGY